MNTDLKNTREWLMQSFKSSFYDTLEESKITPRQKQVAEMRFVKGLMNYQIAMKMHISVKTVESDIKAAYEAVSRLLKTNTENNKSPD